MASIKRGFNKSIPYIFLFALLAGSALLTKTAFAGPFDVNLEVPIPGLSSVTVCQTAGEDVVCEGVMRYVIAAYQWLIRAGVVFAFVMFVIAGFQWLTSAGEAKRIDEAKKKIRDALVGMVLCVGSYTLLWAINPHLVQFEPIRFMKIKPKPLILAITVNSGACCYMLQGDSNKTSFTAPSVNDCRESLRMHLAQRSVATNRALAGHFCKYPDNYDANEILKKIGYTLAPAVHDGIAPPVELSPDAVATAHMCWEDPAEPSDLAYSSFCKNYTDLQSAAAGTGGFNASSEEIKRLITAGKIKFTPANMNGDSGYAYSHGTWARGLGIKPTDMGLADNATTNTPLPGEAAVDARIMGALTYMATTCTGVIITAMNDVVKNPGNPGHSAGSLHYTGGAVDIGGNLCGFDLRSDSGAACTPQITDLIKALKGQGYDVLIYGAKCGAGNDPGTNHIHVELGPGIGSGGASGGSGGSGGASPSSPQTHVINSGKDDEIQIWSAASTATQTLAPLQWIVSPFQSALPAHAATQPKKAHVFYFLHGLLSVKDKESGKNSYETLIASVPSLIKSQVAVKADETIIVSFPKNPDQKWSNAAHFNTVKSKTEAYIKNTLNIPTIESVSIAGHSNGAVAIEALAKNNLEQFKYIGLIDPYLTDTAVTTFKNAGAKTCILYDYNDENWSGNPSAVDRLKALADAASSNMHSKKWAGHNHFRIISDHTGRIASCFGGTDSKNPSQETSSGGSGDLDAKTMYVSKYGAIKGGVPIPCDKPAENGFVSLKDLLKDPAGRTHPTIINNPAHPQLKNIPRLIGYRYREASEGNDPGMAFILPDMVEPLRKVGIDADAQGYILQITTACRSSKRQRALYDDNAHGGGNQFGTIASPGKSVHGYGFGYDFDIVLKNNGSILTEKIRFDRLRQCVEPDRDKNLRDHMEKVAALFYAHGWVRFTKESWHFEWGTDGKVCRGKCTGFSSLCKDPRVLAEYPRKYGGNKPYVMINEGPTDCPFGAGTTCSH